MNGSQANLGSESEGHGSPRGPGIDIQRILAPVDFSTASQHGLAFAAALAERFHSAIEVLHVVEPPVLPEWGYAHIPRREARLRRAAEERLPHFPAECAIDPRLVSSAEVRIGDAGSEIRIAAVERRADLIVLASHGLGGLQHAFAGSTAERVVRLAPCPVLTVRERALRSKRAGQTRFDLKRIVLTTDFSEESKKAFPYAVAFARRFGASLLLLYIVPSHLPAELSHIGFVLEEKRLLAEARESLPRLCQAELPVHGMAVETLVLSGGPAHEICRTAQVHGADLIVMATHGYTGLKHFLLGSVTENVVRHAPCPVLVVRERERDFIKG